VFHFILAVLPTILEPSESNHHPQAGMVLFEVNLRLMELGNGGDQAQTQAGARTAST
jgi:hypothetical protein